MAPRPPAQPGTVNPAKGYAPPPMPPQAVDPMMQRVMDPLSMEKAQAAAAGQKQAADIAAQKAFMGPSLMPEAPRQHDSYLIKIILSAFVRNQ